MGLDGLPTISTCTETLKIPDLKRGRREWSLIFQRGVLVLSAWIEGVIDREQVSLRSGFFYIDHINTLRINLEQRVELTSLLHLPFINLEQLSITWTGSEGGDHFVYWGSIISADGGTELDIIRSINCTISAFAACLDCSMLIFVDVIKMRKWQWTGHVLRRDTMQWNLPSKDDWRFESKSISGNLERSWRTFQRTLYDRLPCPTKQCMAAI